MTVGCSNIVYSDTQLNCLIKNEENEAAIENTGKTNQISKNDSSDNTKHYTIHDMKNDSRHDIKNDTGQDTKNDTRHDTKNDTRNDTKNDTRQDINNDIYTRQDIKNDTRHDINNDTRHDTKNDTRHDTKNDTRHDIKNDTRHDTKNDTRHDTKNDTRHDIKNDTRQDIKNDTRHDTKNDTRHDIKNYTRHDNKNDTRHDIKNDTRHDIKNDTRHDTKNDTRHDTKNDTRHDTKNDTRHDIKNDTRHKTKNDTRHKTKNDTRYDIKNHTRHDTKKKYQKRQSRFCKKVKIRKTSSGSTEAEFIKAISQGNLKMMKCIFDMGLIDVHSHWDVGIPLMAAAEKGKKLAFDTLLSYGFDLTIKDDCDETVLHAACAGGNVDIVKTLIEDQNMDKNARGRSGRTPLLTAAYCGSLEVLRYMIEVGCDVNDTDARGRNALHLACLDGFLDLVEYLVPILGTESKTNFDLTPVMCAAMKGRVKVVWALLQRNCNILARCKRNNTALHYACRNGHIEIVRKLINEYNVSIEIAGYKGYTPFMTAVVYNQSRIASFLVNHRCKKNVRDSKRDTVLHVAAAKRNFYMVSKLIKSYRLNVNARGYKQRTPILTAAKCGHFKIVRLLARKHVRLDSVDVDGNGIFHLACKGGSLRLVKYLTQKLPLKSRTGIRNNENQTPIETAQPKIKKYLQSLAKNKIDYDYDTNIPFVDLYNL